VPSPEPARYDFTGIAEWDQIPGWFDLPKAIAIQQVVKQLRPGARLVELGSFQGRSSVALAAVLPPGGVLYCVDHFRGSEEHHQARMELGDLQESFRRNVERFGMMDRIRVLALPTTGAADQFAAASVDLLLLDAAHDFASVRADLAHWYPKLKPGGFLACDDYHANWPGVLQAIEDCGLQGRLIAPSLWLHQKPGEHAAQASAP
jgi:predicted O-methyltransferase YrrM